MWSHYMFSLFFGEKNQLNEPLLGNYSEGEEERLTLKPDRMPGSDICHNMNKWGSFSSLSAEKQNEKKMPVHVLKVWRIK